MVAYGSMRYQTGQLIRQTVPTANRHFIKSRYNIGVRWRALFDSRWALHWRAYTPRPLHALVTQRALLRPNPHRQGSSLGYVSLHRTCVTLKIESLDVPGVESLVPGVESLDPGVESLDPGIESLEPSIESLVTRIHPQWMVSRSADRRHGCTVRPTLLPPSGHRGN